MDDDLGYTPGREKRVKDRIAALKEERGVRLELASQNKKALQTQVARIKQTLEAVIDSDTTLGGKMKTLFWEQGITIASILTAFGLLIPL